MHTPQLLYVTRNYYNRRSAGNKAKTDNEDTATRLGYRNAGLRRTFIDSKVAAFFLDLAGVLKLCFTMRRGDVLFLQYPIKKYFAFICNVARLKGTHTIALIHDLGSFRRRKLTVAQEIARLSHASYVIASNQAMRQWLVSNGLKSKTGALGLFDYLSDARPEHSGKASADGAISIAYAGSLARRKNSFFLQLPADAYGLTWHIYGNMGDMPELAQHGHMVFHGFTPSEEFIKHAEGTFGLVWDGDSLDTCRGSFGEYLRYNSPHKVSFYLRAGLPVIVWSGAAVAPIVKNRGIGLCIDSLKQLPETLKALKPGELDTMRNNVATVANQLSQGAFLTEALSQAVKALNAG